MLLLLLLLLSPFYDHYTGQTVLASTPIGLNFLLTERVKVLGPNRHNAGQFADVFPSQSLG